MPPEEADRVGEDADRDRHLPLRIKYARFYFSVVADGERVDIPLYQGSRHQERLSAIAEFVKSQGESGVPIEDVQKFEMRHFLVSFETTGKDIKELTFADILIRRGDFLFHEDFFKQGTAQ